MCCDICGYYEECEEEMVLKDDCCLRCIDYKDCIGTDEQGEEDRASRA